MPDGDAVSRLDEFEGDWYEHREHILPLARDFRIVAEALRGQVTGFAWLFMRLGTREALEVCDAWLGVPDE